MSEYNTLIVIMSYITGLSEDELKTKRQYPVPYYRAMITERLRELGYKYTWIGKLFNRNHATLIHGLEQLDNMKKFPIDKQLLFIYKRFRETIENKTKDQSVHIECIWNVGNGERHCEYCTVQFCKGRIEKFNVGQGVIEHMFYTTSDLRVFTSKHLADDWEKKISGK